MKGIGVLCTAGTNEDVLEEEGQDWQLQRNQQRLLA